MTTPTPDVARKLAALLFTDIKGYSSQMDRDEEGALRRLAIHNGIFDRKVAAHNGRTIKTVGDAYMIEFASAVDAVRCGLAVQTELGAHNGAQLEEEHIWVRMGIHVGDVIIKGDDLFGETVNIAARLEPKAPPGQICVSQTVYNSVRRKVDATATDMGKVALKNIKEPFQLYALAPSSEMLDVPAGRMPAGNQGSSSARPLGMVVAAAVAVAALGGIFWYLSQGGEDSARGGTADAGRAVQDAGTSGTPTDIGVAAKPTGPVRGGTLRWGIEGKRTTTFDLRTWVRSVNGVVLEQVFDTLLRFDAETDSLMPGVVASWKVAADAKSLTLTLRDNVHFHPHTCLADGKSRQATVDDLVFSISQSQKLDPSLPLVGLDAFIEGKAKSVAGIVVTKAGGISSVTLTLETPTAFALQNVASDRLLPKELAACGDISAMKTPPGTGPFRLEHPKPGFHFRLVAWEKYWDRAEDGEAAPLLAAIDISAVQDAVTALSRLVKGTLDVVEMGQDAAETVLADITSDAPILKERFAAGSLVVSPQFPPPRTVRIHTLLLLHGDKRATSKKAVRQAIASAINRDVVAPLYAKNTGPAARLLGAGMEGYDPALKVHVFDPSKARQVLGKEPLVQGSDFTIGHYKEHAKAAGAIRAQLTAVGIKARPVELSSEALNDAVRRGSLDAVMFAWQSSTTNQEPYPYLHAIANFLGKVGWGSANIEALVNKVVMEPKRSMRGQAYRALEAQLIQDAQLLPIAVPTTRKPKTFWMSRQGVGGLTDTVTKRVRLTRGPLMQHVWVNAGAN